MSNEIVDSKKKSASEAFVNSFGGYPIGYGLGIIILPLSTGWIQNGDVLTVYTDGVQETRMRTNERVY